MKNGEKEYPDDIIRFDTPKNDTSSDTEEERYHKWVLSHGHELKGLVRSDLGDEALVIQLMAKERDDASFEQLLSVQEKQLNTVDDDHVDESSIGEEFLAHRVPLQLQEIKSEISDLINEIHMLEKAIVTFRSEDEEERSYLAFHSTMRLICTLRKELRRKCVQLYRFTFAFNGEKIRARGWKTLPAKVRKAGGIKLKAELIALQMLDSNALRAYNAELKAESNLRNLQRHKSVSKFNRPSGKDAEWREDRDEAMIGRDAKFDFDPSHRKNWRATYRAQRYPRMIDGKQEFIPNIRILMDTKEWDLPCGVPERFTVCSQFIDVIEDKLFPIQGEVITDENGVDVLTWPEVAEEKANALLEQHHATGHIELECEFLEWNKNEWPCSNLKAKKYAGPGWRARLNLIGKKTLPIDPYTGKKIDIERKSLRLRKGNLVLVLQKPSVMPVFVHPDFAEILKAEKKHKHLRHQWAHMHTADAIELRNKLFEDSCRNTCFVTVYEVVPNRKTDKNERKIMTLVCNEKCEDHTQAWSEHEVLHFSCKQQPIKRVRVWGTTGVKNMRIPLMARMPAKRYEYSPMLTDVYDYIYPPKLFYPKKKVSFKQIRRVTVYDKDGSVVLRKHKVRKDVTKGLPFQGSKEIGPPCKYNIDGSISEWTCYAENTPNSNHGARYTIMGPWATQMRENFMKALFDGDVELCYKIDKIKGTVYQAYKVYKNVKIPVINNDGDKDITMNIVLFCDIHWINESKHIIHKVMKTITNEEGEQIQVPVNLTDELPDTATGYFLS